MKDFSSNFHAEILLLAVPDDSRPIKEEEIDDFVWKQILVHYGSEGYYRAMLEGVNRPKKAGDYIHGLCIVLTKMPCKTFLSTVPTNHKE